MACDERRQATEVRALGQRHGSRIVAVQCERAARHHATVVRRSGDTEGRWPYSSSHAAELERGGGSGGVMSEHSPTERTGRGAVRRAARDRRQLRRVWQRRRRGVSGEQCSEAVKL